MIRSPLLRGTGGSVAAGLEEPWFCEDVTFCDAKEKRKVSPCVLRESSRLKISSLTNSAWGGSPFYRKYFIFPRVWKRVSKFLILIRVCSYFPFRSELHSHAKAAAMLFAC